MARNYKWIRRVVFCAFLIMFIGGGGKPALSQQKELKPYKIGVIVPTTGPFGSFGESELSTMRLMIEKINTAGGINGHKLLLVHDDNECDPAKAASLARKQVFVDKVCAIVGTHPTEGTMQMGRFLEKQKIVFVVLNPVMKVIEGKRFGFMMQNPTEVTGELFARYVSEFFKWKKVAIAVENIAYSQWTAAHGKKHLERAGIKVSTLQFDRQDIDLTPIWVKVRALEPDGVYLAASLPASAYFVKARKMLNITIPLLGADGVPNTRFFELVGDAADGMYFVDYFARSEKDFHPGEKEFMEAYKTKYPAGLPLVFEGFGWDGIKIIAEGMETAGDDPVKLKRAIEQIRGLQGALGEYNYSPEDHTGGSNKPQKITVFKGGRLKLHYKMP